MYRLHKLYKIFLLAPNRVENSFTDTNIFKDFIRINARKQNVPRGMSQMSNKLAHASSKSLAPSDLESIQGQKITEVQNQLQQQLLAVRIGKTVGKRSKSVIATNDDFKEMKTIQAMDTAKEEVSTTASILFYLQQMTIE